MKKIIISFLLIAAISINNNAQVFIDQAIIEFEVKTNVKKTIGNNSWTELLKESMPQFKTGYFQFTFSNNKSIYKFDRWADGPKVPEFLRRDDELNVYYFDFTADKIVQQKAVFGSEILVEDSIPKINWRLTNESRVIAGFNCRKAIGIIMDSVYVFAFYSEEMLIPGGPCTISGLPGMILGLTIPRLYTSFIATKVILNGIKEEDIKPIASKKFSNRSALRTLITERAKEWSSDDDENSRNWRNQFIWRTLL
ncbi:MAG: GLPGLI family protein [Chitinophagaceae bacterium]|nr:GLPGLI family protein [Chitinophagaceae bacterium]